MRYIKYAEEYHCNQKLHIAHIACPYIAAQFNDEI